MAKVYVTEGGRTRKTPPPGPAKKVKNLQKAQTDTKVRKATFIEYVKNGHSIKEALVDMGLTLAQYKYLRQSDASFREEMDRLRLLRGSNEEAEQNRSEIAPFPEWCEQYLDTKLFDHHLQWVDLLERREPRNLHFNQQYIKGDPDYILVNTPPEHAKSTTLTINYVTYRICEDPNVRVVIVSQTETMAKRFLRGIKDRLASENRNYQKLQVDFAPDGGFDGDSSAWTATEIYVNSAGRDSGEKDPTVQAIGINGQIYGARADLIILDDCVVGKNAHEFAKQMNWLQTEVYSRLADPGGQILLIGTRMAPVDLYGEIMKAEHYGDEDGSPWTYLRQPAVLEYDEDPEKWVTLWPYTNRPPVSKKGRAESAMNEDGYWPMWTGPKLRRKRGTMTPRAWALTYMQENTVEDAIFTTKMVNGAVDGMRPVGRMERGNPMCRDLGMDGTYVIGGFDPAMTGNSAAVVMAVDRMTGVRWVVDVWTKGGLKPKDIFDKIKELTVTYRINEWRIEKNAMNMMVTQDEDINNFLRMRGCALREHFTGANKWDADFGVASMSSLFDGWEKGGNLIRLPRATSEGVKALIEQLTTWEPLPPGMKTKKKTDCVMALWFAEIAARDLMNNLGSTVFMHNEFLSSRDKERNITIDLEFAHQAQVQNGWYG